MKWNGLNLAQANQGNIKVLKQELYPGVYI